jgi:uncharacterized protein
LVNLSKPEYHGRKNEKGNVVFRTHPKCLDNNESEIDAIVYRMNAWVTKQIYCTKCAHCCKEMGPRIMQHDIRAISKYMDITPETVISQYLKERKNKAGEYLVARIPCPFLKENRCSIYEVRPEGCKSYPRIRKTVFISRLVGIVGSYPMCPLVVNVCENLSQNGHKGKGKTK